MLAKFLFGKRRAVRRKVSKRKVSKRKVHRKLPAKLVKLCKRYHVKTTTKRGGKRVTKSVAVLKRSVAKKIKILLKRAKKHVSKRRVSKRRVVRRRPSMQFGACGGNTMPKAMSFGKHRKVSKAAAMKAFKQFYSKHCTRRSRFGNGGNPMLSQSMGYEFCSGGGGVLGANSTGLFPSPCMNETTAFGKRRRIVTRRRKSGFGRFELPPPTSGIENYRNGMEIGRRRKFGFGASTRKKPHVLRFPTKDSKFGRFELPPPTSGIENYRNGMEIGRRRKSGFGERSSSCGKINNKIQCMNSTERILKSNGRCEWNNNRCYAPR
jgi:hypothetical protein